MAHPLRTQQRRGSRSPHAEAYHKWYSTARWQKLAKHVYARDLYVCQKTGELLMGKHPAPNSPAAHHIRAHNGDPTLFWNPENIQTVSKRYHDSEEQRIEKGGRPRQLVGKDGWPV